MHIVLVISLGLMMAAVVFGNVLVCISVFKVRKLRHPSNYLLVSLAIADLCVGILVMPLALYYEVQGQWNLGPTVCDLWISFDQSSCSASIINLCMISVDRYLAITQPLTYGVKRTTKRMSLLILAVWVTACLISVPPLLIFSNDYGTENEPMCGYSQNIIYQLYATLGAFYIPLLVMIILYYKIYVAAKRVVDAELKAQYPSKCKVPKQTPLLKIENAEHADSGIHQVGFEKKVDSVEPSSDSWVKADSDMYDAADNREIVIEVNVARKEFAQNNGLNEPKESISRLKSSLFAAQQKAKKNKVPLTSTHNKIEINKRYTDIDSSSGQQSKSNKRRTSSIIKERKASIVLGVIMSAFIVCWLPFFIMALLGPFEIDIPSWAKSFALWLGFANSMLNPIIYVTFHQDFRQAFRYLLCLKCNTIDALLREEAFKTQFGNGDRIHI